MANKDYEFVCYVDGRVLNGGVPADLNDANVDSCAALTGNGVETHVYVDDLNEFVIITIKNNLHRRGHLCQQLRGHLQDEQRCCCL